MFPKEREMRWKVEVRKTCKGYKVQRNDIIVGLVRPERRNVGMYLEDDSGVFASPDGVAVIRQKSESYPIEWIFHALRTESSRLQFWTESGGTSYGKLTLDQIRNLMIAVPDKATIAATAVIVSEWAASISLASTRFHAIWEAGDKVAILNSPILGLEAADISLSPEAEEAD